MRSIENVFVDGIECLLLEKRKRGGGPEYRVLAYESAAKARYRGEWHGTIPDAIHSLGLHIAREAAMSTKKGDNDD